MKPKILLIDPPFYRLFKDTYTLHRYPLYFGYLACTIKRDTNWEVMTYNAEYNLIDPMCTEPYNIGYMASEGFDNYTNNINDTSKLIWQEIKVAIEKYGPQVVGISIKTQNFASARRVAEIVKNLNPETIVVAGGPHPTMVGAEVLNYNVFDICVIGEGEQTIVELLHAINKRTRLSEVKGLVYNENGRIVKTGKRELLENLDLLCFPHRKAPEVLKDHDKQ